MSRIKEQAVELLLDIPDEKVETVIEILKGLLSLYSKKDIQESDDTKPSAFGIFNKYANKDLIPLEKEAWGRAVSEKYVAY